MQTIFEIDHTVIATADYIANIGDVIEFRGPWSHNMINIFKNVDWDIITDNDYLVTGRIWHRGTLTIKLTRI